MHIKRLVLESPSLYVVRYDEDFVSKLDEKTSSYVKSAKIPGTIVCLYENNKHCKKVEKFLSDYTVCIDKVDKRFILKYLHSEFKRLPDDVLEFVSGHSRNYGHARNVATCISYLDRDSISSLSKLELSKMCSFSEESDSIVNEIIRKDINYLLCNVCNGDVEDSYIYAFLSASLELEKVLSTPSSLNYKNYSRFWTIEDSYNLFVHSYDMIKKIRSLSCSPTNCLIYLISLLSFRRIPQFSEVL